MMANSQRFLFTSNSLSKKGFMKSLLQIMSFQSSKNKKIATVLLANFFGVQKNQVFLFGAGRMSVYTFLKSLKLDSSDEVIVAGYTCVVLTNAVKFVGCRLKYVDIDESTLNIDPELLIQSISSKTKALIIPHNFGIPFNGISEIKARFPDLVIIEDVAHSFGSISADGELCGTIGDASFFSLEYSKPLTTGLGGVMIINNKKYLSDFTESFNQIKEMKGAMVCKLILSLGTYNLMYSKRTDFFQKNLTRVFRRLGLLYRTSTKEIEGVMPDNYPVRMNSKLACFLIPQLSQIDRFNKEKQVIIKSYDEAFKGFKDLVTIDVDDHILVRYPILFKEYIKRDKIEKIKAEGAKAGLNFGTWFNDVVHPVGSYRYDYTEKDCPVGESVSNRILNLPVNVTNVLTANEINEVVELFRKNGIN